MSEIGVIGAVVNVDFDNTRSRLGVSVPGAPLQARAKLSMDNSWSIGARRLPHLAGHSAVRHRRLHPGPHERQAQHRRAVSRNDCVCTRAELRGGFIGAGAQTLITEHISLRGEYRFTDFGSGKLGLPTINGTDINDFIVAHAAPTMQDTRVSVNYRF